MSLLKTHPFAVLQKEVFQFNTKCLITEKSIEVLNVRLSSQSKLEHLQHHSRPWYTNPSSRCCFCFSEVWFASPVFTQVHLSFSTHWCCLRHDLTSILPAYIIFCFITNGQLFGCLLFTRCLSGNYFSHWGACWLCGPRSCWAVGIFHL